MPTIVSARKLIDSNNVYSCDWSHYTKPACDCADFDLHTCVKPSKQWADVFSRISLNGFFVEHILLHGVMQPIGFGRSRVDGQLLNHVFNGHHRLTVAYRYNLYIPITLEDDPFSITSNDTLPSGW